MGSAQSVTPMSTIDQGIYDKMSSTPQASTALKRDLRAVVESAYDSASRQEAASKGVNVQLFLLPYHRKLIQLYELIVNLGELRNAVGLNTPEHFPVDVAEHYSTDIERKLHAAFHEQIVHFDPLDHSAPSYRPTDKLMSLSNKWCGTLPEHGLDMMDMGVTHLFYNMASCCFNAALSLQADLDEAGKLERAKRAMKFCHAMLSGESSRACLRKQLCKTLPTELTERILEFLAVAICPSIVRLKTGISSQVLAVPGDLQRLPTLDLLVRWCLRGLATIAARDDTSCSVDITEALESLEEHMKEAIIKNIGISTPALFPNESNPDQLPYPAVLQPHTNQIRFLHLTIELPNRPGPTYPVQIYQAQDQLDSLLKYMPNLQLVTLTVVESFASGTARGPYRKRGMKPGFTNIGDEMEKLVAPMRKLAVKKCSLVYYNQNLAGNLTRDANWKYVHEWMPETKPERSIYVDEDESEAEVVQKMMNNGGGCEVVLRESKDTAKPAVDPTGATAGVEQATQALATAELS